MLPKGPWSVVIRWLKIEGMKVSMILLRRVSKFASSGIREVFEGNISSTFFRGIVWNAPVASLSTMGSPADTCSPVVTVPLFVRTVIDSKPAAIAACGFRMSSCSAIVECLRAI